MDVVRLLLDAGAEKDITNHEVRTALMFAVCGGHVEVAYLLVGDGCDVNVQDSRAQWSRQFVASPEGPSTQYLRTLIPNTIIRVWFLGPVSLTIGYLHPLGTVL